MHTVYSFKAKVLAQANSFSSDNSVHVVSANETDNIRLLFKEKAKCLAYPLLGPTVTSGLHPLKQQVDLSQLKELIVNRTNPDYDDHWSLHLIKLHRTIGTHPPK